MTEKVTWENLVELAEEIRKNSIRPTKDMIAEHGRKLNDYICAHSKKQTNEENAEWLSIKKGKKEYKMDVTFYQRVTVLAKDYNPTSMHSNSIVILCYRISEIEKCSAEVVCETFITLGLFAKRIRFNQDLLDELKGDREIKDNLNSDNITEDVSIEQESHNTPGKSIEEIGLSEYNAKAMGLQGNDANDAELLVENDKCLEDSLEDTEKDIRSDISQPISMNKDTEVTEENLKTFVIGFIEVMSYKIKAFYPREHSSCSELISIFLDESCVDELSIFHQDIKPWEFVRVTYFASGTVNEEIQQEIEWIHKLEKLTKAFVMIACATDEIFKYVEENVICDRQKSIMIFCSKHPDEAHIHLKKSDKKRFEFLKPDSKKYIYI